MDKFAQRRSALKKLIDLPNQIGGAAAEKYFSPELEKVMNSLREADDKIRSVVSGTSVEGQDPGEDMVSLKELYKQAKSNFNRREYITAVNFLGRFHRKMEMVSKMINKLDFDVNQVHHDFLFKDLDPEQQSQLEKMRERFAQGQYRFVKEAGIMDFLSNLTSTRGRALAAWEKRYPNQVKKFRNDVKNLLTRSEAMLNTTLNYMKEMASHRATRKVDNFMAAAQKISNTFTNYDKNFEELYGANIKNFVNTFLDNQKKVQAPSETINDGAKELANQEVGIPPNADYDPTPVSEHPGTIPSSDAPSSQPEGVSPEAEHAYEEAITPGSSALKPPKVPHELEKQTRDTISEGLSHNNLNTISGIPNLDPSNDNVVAHRNFVHSLETLSSEEPILLAAHIKRYAKKIEGRDPKIAAQLFNVLKCIKLG